MRRRLDLALALVHEPKVLFLDEPTTGLDPTSRVSLWDEVRRLNTEFGTTVFLTTQYLEEADRLAHEVAIMDRGQIVAQGSPEALKASIGTDVVTVRPEDGAAGLDATAHVLASLEGASDVRRLEDAIVVYIAEGARAIPRIVLLLDEAGLRIAEITLARPTLDDVFLRNTGHHLQAGAPIARPEKGGRS